MPASIPHHGNPPMAKARASRSACFFAGQIAFFAGALLAMDGRAAELSSTGRLTVQGSYETNPELLRRNERHVAEKQLSPGLVGELLGETYGIDFDLGMSMVRTSDETVTPDSLRYDTTVGGRVDAELFRLTGSVDYSKQAFDNTEFNDDELTTDAGSASVSNNETVDDITLTSRLEHDWSERSTVFLEDAYRVVSFTGGNSTDFTNVSLSSGVVYQWSETLAVTPGFEVRRFDPADNAPTDIVEGSLGFEQQLNDTTAYDVTIGMLKTGDEAQVTFDATFEKLFQDYFLQLNGNRQLSPNDEGELQDRRTFGLDISRELSDRTRAGIDAIWTKSEDLDSRRLGFNISHDVNQDVLIGFSMDAVQSISENAVGDTKTMQYRADPFVNWIVAENLSARLSYRELWEDTDALGSVNTRRVTLAVTYTKTLN